MGKATLVYVIGLSIIVGYGLMNINRGSTSSMDTFNEYYGRTMAHNIATAAANIGTRNALANPSSLTPRSGSFAGGTYKIMFDTVGVKRDIRVTATSEIDLYDKIFTSEKIRDTVVAYLKKISFSKYGYFSNAEVNGFMSPSSNSTTGGNMWKITGDSLFGFAHTNGRWNLAGRPYFHDKITGFNIPPTTSPPIPSGWGYNPHFNAGSQWGVTVSRPAGNLTRLESEASSTGALYNNNDMALTFLANGTVARKFPASTGTIHNDTIPLGTLAPKGVIAVKNGDVRVKGVYSGQITVVSLTGATSTKGNVWIDGDIVANVNPSGNTGSPDMMGLVAQRMAYITTTGITRNASSVLNIQAAIYTHNGVLGVENYSSCGISGRLNLFGALTMAASTVTGTMSGGSLTNGFLKSIRHDPRYLSDAPPGFPFSDKYELVSWWEK